MIIDLKKYLFVGAKDDLTAFFLKAQEDGFIEFITPKKQLKDLPEPVKKLVDAIKILRKQPVKEPVETDEGVEYADEVATQILDLTHEIEKLSEEKRFVESEIARVAPFGEFSFDDIEYIESHTKKKIQFYCVKSSKSHEVEDANALIYVGTDYDLDYFIGIHSSATSYPGMIEMHFDQTAAQLRNHLAFINETLHQVEAELKGFAGHMELLRDALLENLDVHTLDKTQKGVEYQMGKSLFTIQGWVPANKVDELDGLIGQLAIFYEPIAIEKSDKVPTYMENQKTSKVGEDLVRIYDIPAPTDKDPSNWVLWAFVFFFAMIIADGGYGALFLALAFFVRHKFPKLQGGAKRFLKLMFMLATSCIIWGILTTSFFGLNINPTNPISTLSVLNNMAAKKAEYHAQKNDSVNQEWVEILPQIKGVTSGKEILAKGYVDKGKIRSYVILDEYSDNILLELSLLIGVIHISLSLLRYLPRSWANIGWASFAIGGYLYFPVTLQATSLVEFLGWIPKSIAETVGLQLLYGGLGGAVVLALIQKRLKGIGEIAQVIQVFADILSYLRLYALALASTIMARTFNDMGANIGLVVGSVVIIAGHAINLTLGTMGGVIHGLRLNFIEWYHFSFEGEGRLFNPLRKLKKMKQE